MSYTLLLLILFGVTPYAFTSSLYPQRIIVFPPAVCDAIVAAAEEYGFNQRPDSVDGNPSDDIYIIDEGVFQESEAIHALILPYLEALQVRLKTVAPDNPHKLGWVFLRRYRAGYSRRALRGHTDDNLHTITVKLNAEFEGGELWFATDETCAPQEAACQEGPQPGGLQTNSAFIPKNVSSGEGVLYPKGMWHGILPVSRGVRYSLALFYDQTHVDGQVEVIFFNSCRFPVTVVWIDQHNYDAVSEMSEQQVVGVLKSGEEMTTGTYEGHVFAAISGQQQVQQWAIEATRVFYRIFDWEDEAEEEMGDQIDGQGGQVQVSILNSCRFIVTVVWIDLHTSSEHHNMGVLGPGEQMHAETHDGHVFAALSGQQEVQRWTIEATKQLYIISADVGGRSVESLAEVEKYDEL